MYFFTCAPRLQTTALVSGGKEGVNPRYIVRNFFRLKLVTIGRVSVIYTPWNYRSRLKNLAGMKSDLLPRQAVKTGGFTHNSFEKR
jgi:hypothetical protein